MYASVVVDAESPSLGQRYTYCVPEELRAVVHKGICVAVPFAGRELVGYVFELTQPPSDVKGIKDIIAVVPEACALSPPLLDLAQWMSRYYVTSLGQCVRAILPEVMSASVSSTVKLLDPDEVSSASPNQQRLVETLIAMGGQAEENILKAKVRLRNFGTVLRRLRDRRAVEIVRVLELPKARPRVVQGLQAASGSEDVPMDTLGVRAPRQAQILRELQETGGAVRRAELLRKTGSSASPARALVHKGLAEKIEMRVRRDPFEGRARPGSEPLPATADQEGALRLIIQGLESGRSQTTLLYGVTGSGKTEVYLQSISCVIERGRGCIALVPEISLTSHLLEAYKSRFGERVAVLHSRLSVGERHDEWRRIENGDAKVVLGARSAVFAPLKDLGLVVVDEEHEPSYKQDHAPRYNARTAAEERARVAGASVVLGSATPSVESFYRASSGEIQLAILGSRIDDRPLPKVTMVDLRSEFGQGRRSIFSNQLQDGIAERLRRREQVILFVNRRGYASFILCRSCGYTPRCSNCDVSLTYHTTGRKLRCHHCNAVRPAPTTCPQCGGHHIRQFGVGTERVQEEASRTFSDCSVIRMDSDTTARKSSYSELLGAFREGRADILVGTQMVAKGFDFPNVTLVGVVSADTMLHLPDFRSAERTFQLLTQVSGRAGRGDLPGEVVVQSFSPEHYAIRAAARQDYLSFYGQEIAHRRELGYPPFSRLINLAVSDPVEQTAEQRTRALAEQIRIGIPTDCVDILGPAPAPLSKLKGMYRWHLVLRNRGDADLQPIIAKVLEGGKLGRPGLTVDVDPGTML